MSNYHLPVEIQFQIFKCFPVKTLLQFRCVCKWWKQLIDSPSFIQHHLALQNQNPRFLFECEGEPEFLILDPLTLPLSDTLRSPTEDIPLIHFHLVGTLHGIVCLYNCHKSIYLWNPSLRKFLTLPPFPQLMDLEWRLFGDITYSAFWIHPYTKHFKIIIFCFQYGENKDGGMYSSTEGNWKVLPLGEVRKCVCHQECPPIVIGGVAYWRACHESRNAVLLSFDFGLDRFDIIQGPPVKLKGWDCSVLCKWKDTLTFACLDESNCESYRCDIYSRQEGSWLHTLGFNLTPNVGRVLRVLVEVDDKGMILSPIGILSTINDELVLCDTGGGCMSVKKGFPKSNNFYLAYDFVESILFP